MCFASSPAPPFKTTKTTSVQLLLERIWKESSTVADLQGVVKEIEMLLPSCMKSQKEVGVGGDHHG